MIVIKIKTWKDWKKDFIEAVEICVDNCKKHIS